MTKPEDRSPAEWADLIADRYGWPQGSPKHLEVYRALVAVEERTKRRADTEAARRIWPQPR